MRRIVYMFMKTTTLLSMILALTLLSLSAGHPADPPFALFDIPFNEKDKTQKYFTFDVEINGKKANVLFDTGSNSAARILQASADRIGVPSGGGKVDIKIGDIVLKDSSIRCVKSFTTNYPKDIILGYGVIKNLYAIIDYPTNRALLFPCTAETSYEMARKIANEKFGEQKSEVVLPLISPDGHILVEATVRGQKFHFAIDTGWLGFNILTSNAAKALGASEKMARLDMTIDGHEYKNIVFKNKPVPILEQAVAGYKKSGQNFGGILGVPDFLGHYIVGIDYKEKKLHLGSIKAE